MNANGVRLLYERYPFPFSSVEAGPLDDDLAAYLDLILGGARPRRVLDAGCGTGHRTVAVARRFPDARVTGIDLSRTSLGVAASLARHRDAPNLALLQGDLLGLPLDSRFDLVFSIGVAHHLPDPRQGLRSLLDALDPRGVLVAWLYHSLGEADRLRRRELLHCLWDPHTGDLEEGRALMEALGLDLEEHRYGRRARDSGRIEGNTDAFLNPIVHAYRFGEVAALLRAAGATWMAVDTLTLHGSQVLLDLAHRWPADSAICVRPRELFGEGSVRDRIDRLSRLQRLRVVELHLQPTGFLVLAGRDDPPDALEPRSAGNRIDLA